jgi:hypothetical protein
VPFNARAIDEAVRILTSNPITKEELEGVNVDAAPSGCCVSCWSWYTLRDILEGLPHNLCEAAIKEWRTEDEGEQ